MSADQELEVEVVGLELTTGALTESDVRRLCARALATAGVQRGHVAVHFVEPERIHELNREHRGRDRPTDVLSFPVDEAGPARGPRELGDVLVCPPHTVDLAEAVVHGALHLAGMDHEADDGKMLARQRAVLAGEGVIGSEAGTRSGFVALAGRPNVGKSTLVNAMVGVKVAIVSDKPQTTRRAIRGILENDDWQMVLVDLPGVQRPRDALTARMQRRVEEEVADCDHALLVLDGTRLPGPGDRFTAAAVAGAGVRATIALNKIDRLGRPATVAALAAASELLPEADVFPISARAGTGVPELVGHLAAGLPAGPWFFPAGQRSDLPEAVELAELVREQVLVRTRQELPHAVEVSVDEVRQKGEHWRVGAQLWVETESQKGIVIGAGGRMIKALGTSARREIERRLGEAVHLDLQVRVRRRWRGDDSLLDRLGL